MPPISISTVRLGAESASRATAMQQLTVKAAASLMPQVGPARSTSRPAGTDPDADTT